MSLPATQFVDVNISLAAGAAEKFSFGNLLGVFDHSATANRFDGPYASEQELTDAGFDSVSEPEVAAWGSAVFAQDDGVDQVFVGRRDVGDATWTATMDAIEAEAGTDAWYGTTAETRTEADILLVAAWVETRRKIYIAQSSDAEILSGGAGNVALDLQAAGYNRTALIYHALDDSAAGSAPAHGYLDGGWASSGLGLNLDSPGGAGTWMYRVIDGIPFDDVSLSEASEIWDANANLFGRSKGLNFTSKGTMASGRYIDVTTSVDWIAARLEEEILSLFVNAGTKIPFTEAGINHVRAATEVVFGRGVSFGHLSPDVIPTLTTPKIGDISDADKAARELNVQAHVQLAGAIHKVTYNITVSQ